MTKQEQWQKLFGHLLGYQATWIIDVGLRTGLLAAIAEAGPVREEALAERLGGLDRRYLGVWLRAAYAYELVEWDEADGYSLAEHIRQLLLDPADPQFLGGRLQFVAALYEDFRAFPKYLREGGSWPRAEHDPFLLKSLESMTKPDAVMIADAVLPYARRFPRTEVVGIEYDKAQANLARQAVAGERRIEIRQADANQLTELEAFDLVTMNVALHETGGPSEWRNVLSRVYAALRPGGALVVSELPYPDSLLAYREQPVYKALTGVQFHETLVGCGAITQSTLLGLVAEAGFRNVRVADQPVATRFVVVGEKG